MANLRSILHTRSPIAVAALLSVAVMVLAGAAEVSSYFAPQSAARIANASTPSVATTPGPDWSQEMQALGITPAASSSDPIADIGQNVLSILSGAYDTMQENGTYTPQNEEALTSSVASSLQAPVTYHTYAASDLTTTTDTSYDSMMRYRTALQTSLTPLKENSDSEIAVFAQYVQSGDTKYLDELRTIAQSYYAAATSSAAVTVPADAVSVHLGILNAMEEFGATLDALADHADDPYASIALITTYNHAEGDMLSSFNNLATYFKSKQP